MLLCCVVLCCVVSLIKQFKPFHIYNSPLSYDVRLRCILTKCVHWPWTYVMWPLLSPALVGLSFSGAIGLTFLLLGCALEQYGWVCYCISNYYVIEYELPRYICLFIHAFWTGFDFIVLFYLSFIIYFLLICLLIFTSFYWVYHALLILSGCWGTKPKNFCLVYLCSCNL